MNVGRLRVSYGLLASLLRLPEGTTILQVDSDCDDTINARFSIVVGGHRTLPHHTLGAVIPLVGLTVATHPRESSSFFE